MLILQVTETRCKTRLSSLRSQHQMECDILICELKLITNLMKGNKLGLTVGSLEEGSKK